MSDMKNTLENYPNISFIESLTLESLQNQMIQDYEDKYREVTGEAITLSLADPNRLILYAASLQIYQGLMYLDSAGKQSFLKYSYGDFLDNLGALKGIERLQGTGSRTVIRFTLSSVQKSVVAIPRGTRVTAGDNIYFYVTETVEITAGAKTVDVDAICLSVGKEYDGYAVGDINILVDPIAYIESVTNITESSGGSDIEDDTSLAERIFLAPSSYSVAGPADAYQYWVKTYNTDISDVYVSSPSDGVVDIRFTMDDGKLPDSNIISGLKEYLEDGDVRPLTDHVQVSAPDVSEYDITIQYWINASDKTRVNNIKTNVESAVENYKIWQKARIGRDINPNKLNYLVMEAGVKRVEITSPIYTKIPETSIAQDTLNVSIVYGGIEDD